LSIVAADNNVIRRRRLNAHGVRNEKAAIVQEDAGLWGRMLDDYSMSCPSECRMPFMLPDVPLNLPQLAFGISR
jgi:hypothetical protein